MICHRLWDPLILCRQSYLYSRSPSNCTTFVVGIQHSNIFKSRVNHQIALRNAAGVIHLLEDMYHFHSFPLQFVSPSSTWIKVIFGRISSQKRNLVAMRLSYGRNELTWFVFGSTFQTSKSGKYPIISAEASDFHNFKSPSLWDLSCQFFSPTQTRLILSQGSSHTTCPLSKRASRNMWSFTLRGWIWGK